MGRDGTALAGEEKNQTTTEYTQNDLKSALNQIVVIGLDEAVLSASKREIPQYDPSDLENDEIVYRFTQQILKFHRMIEKEEVAGIAYDLGFHPKLQSEIWNSVLNKTSIPTVWTSRQNSGRASGGMHFRPLRKVQIKYGIPTMILEDRYAQYKAREFDFPSIPYVLAEIGNVYSSHRYPPAIRIESISDKWFQTISMADIVSKKIPSSTLIGKYLFVGVKMAGIDEKTFRDKYINGVFFHALAMAALMKFGEYKTRGVNMNGINSDEWIVIK